MEDKLDKLIELLENNNNKKTLIEDLSITKILQLLLIPFIIWFASDYFSSNKQDILQQEFNKQQTENIKSIKEDLEELSKKFSEFSKVKRFTEEDSNKKLDPIITNITSDINNIKTKLDYRREWMQEREEFEFKTNLKIKRLEE